VIGKTNVPELMIFPFTESERFGATHNPWDLGRTTGGSSGGSAAAGRGRAGGRGAGAPTAAGRCGFRPHAVACSG